MRDSTRRARLTLLALVFASAAVLPHPASPETARPDGPRLVLQSGHHGFAVPTSTWSGALESGGTTSPPPDHAGTRQPAHDGTAAASPLHGPSAPEVVCLRPGGFLFGLGAAPANAPPHV